MATYLETHISVDTAVLIPCLNEAGTIAATCRAFKAALPDAFICVGDNNSTDGTAAAAMGEPACDAVVRCPVPGKGAATREMALTVKAGWYLTVDGDMTYGADAAAKMLRMAKERHCVVTGERDLCRENQPLFHKPGNRLVDRLVSLRCGRQARDVMSGYRAMPGELLQKFVLTSPYDGFEIETAFAIYALSNGWDIEYIPCRFDARPDGSKSKLRTFRDGARILRTVFLPRFIEY